MRLVLADRMQSGVNTIFIEMRTWRRAGDDEILTKYMTTGRRWEMKSNEYSPCLTAQFSPYLQFHRRNGSTTIELLDRKSLNANMSGKTI